MGYIIADSQEAQPLLQSGVVLACLAGILRQYGVVLQQWALDDEMVLTVAKHAVTKAQLKKELHADEPHRPLREVRPNSRRPASPRAL
jgi:hypothetical protein